MENAILYKKTDDIENLSIYGYDVHYTYLNNNWAPHYHRAMEVIYIIEGTATVFVNRQKYTFKPGDFIVIDSMKMHELVYRKRRATGIIIEISKNYMKKFLPDLEVLNIDCCSQNISDQEEMIIKLQKIFENISLVYKNQEHGFLFRSASLVMELLAVLTENFSSNVYEVLPENFISQMERLGSLIDYIEENYQRPITLQEAADYTGFNREYFCRYFKKNVGYSFMEFLSNVRINHIYQELLLTSDPVYDIIERNGYTNQKLFYSKFRKKYGYTPGQIRKLHEA